MLSRIKNVADAAIAGVVTHLAEAGLVGGLSGIIDEAPNVITDPNVAAIVVAICVFIRAEITGREKNPS